MSTWEQLAMIREPDWDELVRSTDPDTSRAAAVRLSGKAGTMRKRLLEVFANNISGLTAEEASQEAGFSSDEGPWKRISDLLNAGLLVDTGKRRMASTGRMQRVLTLSEFGRKAVGV